MTGTTGVPWSLDRLGLRPRPSGAVRATTSDRSAMRERVALLVVGMLGVLVRAYYVARADFPLNDGGLFYVMIRDLQAAHYRLPIATSYNGLGIPYAYSPFGLYAGALFADLTGMGVVAALRVLPVLGAALTLLGAAGLARRLLPGSASRVAALAAFALVPRSFAWMIMGGGLTRSFGFAFALLALWQAHVLYTERRLSALPWAALWTALSVMSHLGTAPWLALSIVLLWLWYGRDRWTAAATLALGAGAVLLTAPWWLTVVRAHGWSPFLAARATGDTLFSDYQARVRTEIAVARLGVLDLGEPLFPVVGALALLGAVAVLPTRLVLLPLWWVLTLLIDARQGSTFASVPIALAAGLGSSRVLLPLLRRAGREWERGPGARLARRTRRAELGQGIWVPVAGLAAVLLYAIAASLVSDTRLGSATAALDYLDTRDRAAMRWVAEHTPAAARVLVVTGEPWYADRYSEWFPVLAARRSVATAQGYEWLPVGAFARQKEVFRRAQECAHGSGDCLEGWAERQRQDFGWVYIPKRRWDDCCGPLAQALRQDPRYVLAYDGPGARVFARRGR